MIMHHLFQGNLDFVYFVYGGSFFFAGLAILIQFHNESDIELGSAIYWLGLFGVLHGFNEWLDMWQIIKKLPGYFHIVGPLVLLISYIPLFEFGRRTITAYRDKKGLQFGPSFLCSPWMSLALGAIIFLLSLASSEFLIGIRIFSRYTFGFLGAALTGLVFLWTTRIYRTEISNLGSSIPFYITGIAFLIYAPLGGLFGPEAGFFPASVVNENSFLLTVHVPVQLLRSVCAVTALIGISSMLRFFRIETLQKLKHEKDRVIKLNTELGQRVKERTVKLEETNKKLNKEAAERNQVSEKLRYLAYYDELTGLPNRLLFTEHLEQALSRAKRSNLKVGIMVIDLERLKSVNDSLGRKAGDIVIRESGRRIRDTTRETDMVARISGDEFILAVETIEDPAQIMQLGNRIREAINQPLELLGNRVYPDCSIAFSVYPDDSINIDMLLRQADMAMFEAKKSSFVKVHGFVEQEDWIAQQFYLEHELKSALERDQFLIYYQPKVDLQSRQILGVEALLRWQHPEKGLVSPGEFIPVLEKTGMINLVSQWVIQQVGRQLRAWQEEGIQTKVSVNISAQQFDDDQLIKSIRECMRGNGIDGKQLEVELTETALMNNIYRATVSLETLSGWDVSVALDDFGKGYSSLSYLQQLALDIIKLDKQFVLGLPESKNDMILVQTIVDMAHNLGKKVLAEGVEREDQVQALLEMGCDYAQGFLFSRPMPAEQVASLFSQKIL